MPRWPSHDQYMPAVLKLYEERGGHLTTRAIMAELGVSRDLAVPLRNEALEHLGLPKPHPKSARGSSDDDVLDVLRELVKRLGLRAEIADATRAVHDAGLRCSYHRVKDLLYIARNERAPTTETPAGEDFGPLESKRLDGLLTGPQLAAGYGVHRLAVYDAMRRGELTPAKVEGTRRPRYLYDPAKVTRRRDGWNVPCDAGHPLAAD